MLTDWSAAKVGDVFDFIRSVAFSRDNLSWGRVDDLIGNVHYGDIHATYSASSLNFGVDSIPLVKDSGYSPRKEILLRDGDLIMADVSEDYDGIGEAVSVHGVGAKKITGGLHTFVLRDNKGHTDEYFRKYIFKNKETRRRLKEIATGVSVFGISKGELSKVVISLPPIVEQKRIVAVLETWDKVIELLEKKIEHKKQVKKGLMQQLLTGKKSLPEFEGKWRFMAIGEFAEQYSSLNTLGVVSEVLSCTKYDGLVRSLEYFKRQVYGADLKKYKIVPRNYFAYATNHIEEGSIGYQNIVAEGLVSPMYTVFSIKNVEAGFLYPLLKSERMVNKYKSNMGASVNRRGGLRWPEFSKIKVKMPVDQVEQSEIAKIITVAQDEMNTLSQKLSLLKDQKKYLLNNLVTGKIRTPENLNI